jgi:hypothetical protein
MLTMIKENNLKIKDLRVQYAKAIKPSQEKYNRYQ